MKRFLISAITLVVISACSTQHEKTVIDNTTSVEIDYLAAARTAAGSEWTDKVDSFCGVAPGSMENRPPPGGKNRKLPHTPVPPKNWQKPAVQVFDNLFFTGSKGVTSFAITTSEGIIITDAMWAYDIEESVAGGLKSLGLDPQNIEYVIIPHGHPDHYGGANFLHENYGAKIVAPKHEIAEIARFEKIDTTPQPKQYDVLIEDGDTLTLGDTTVTFHEMPGHSPHGVVLTFPVKIDNAQHSMLIWAAGGAAPNKIDALQKQIPALEKLVAYVEENNVDAFSENHGGHDAAESLRLSPEAGNPFFYGNEKVANYLKMRLYCDQVRLKKLQ